MRLRITLAFVGVLALAIGIAGLVTLTLVHNAQSQSLRQSVEHDSQTLIAAVKAKGTGADISKTDVFDVIEQIAGVKLVVIGVNPDGTMTSPSPPGLPNSVIQAGGKGRRLAEGQIISGVYKGVAYSAGPLVQAPKSTIAFLFIAQVPLSSGLYFLIAGLVALGVTALLAAWISRRIARRVIRVARVAEQIASGDFDVRLGSGSGDYPEIAQLDRAIDSMAADLARAQQQEREFLLSISHDLRTPLTSIRGYAEAIADGAVPDPTHAAGVVVDEATRLQRLIGDLLDLARLRARQFTLEPSVVDLGQAAAHAADALAVAFADVGVSIESRQSDGAIEVRVDPHRLGQVAANLLENALKYAASSVVISVASTDDTATLSVEDDGPGIDPEDLPHVLERLFTSDRHPARAGGSGLGLAIVAELTAAMGGTIAVDSPTREVGGTRITVSLPFDESLPGSSLR